MIAAFVHIAAGKKDLNGVLMATASYCIFFLIIIVIFKVVERR
jgi:hypothetical protein